MAYSRAMAIDTILIGYHDLFLPAALGDLPKGDPVGGFYRRSYVRLPEGELSGIRHQRTHTTAMEAVSGFRNAATGEDGYYHWAETAPAALHILTITLRRAGFTVEPVRLLSAEHDRVAHLLEHGDPRSVTLITTFFFDPAVLIDAVLFIRRHNTRTKIILGGPYINSLCRERSGKDLRRALEICNGDIYVQSPEGEKTLTRVLAALRQGDDMTSIPNLYLRETGYQYTGREVEDNDMNVPLDWDLLSDEELGEVIGMRTARSCAFECSFCDYPVKMGALTLASVETVMHQLRQLDRRGVRHVHFMDDTFNVPLPRFIELLQSIKEARLGLSWTSFLRCSNVRKDEHYDLIRDSGCRGVYLGIESASDEVLTAMNKAADVRRYEIGLEKLHERDIHTHTNFMVGFPSETPESIATSLAFLNRMQPSTYHAVPWYYHHHTPIHREAEKYSLTGRGWIWKHATMASDDAHHAVDRFFDEVTGPTVASPGTPSLLGGFWGVAQWRAWGIEDREVREIFRHVAAVQRCAFNGASGLDAAAAAFRTYVEKLPLRKPVFTYSTVKSYKTDFMELIRLRGDFFGEGQATMPNAVY